MNLLPAAIVFIGLVINATIEEHLFDKKTSQDEAGFILGATLVFSVLGILFGISK